MIIPMHRSAEMRIEPGAGPRPYARQSRWIDGRWLLSHAVLAGWFMLVWVAALCAFALLLARRM